MLSVDELLDDPPALPPDMQIRLLAQEANFHGTAEESLYVRCLRFHGIREDAALDAYRFVQIALGRRLAAMKKVRTFNLFHRFDKDGHEIECGDFSNHPVFIAATALAAGLFTLRAAKVIGYSSPEVRASVAQLARGVHPRRVRLRPCILLTALPSPALIRRVKREVDARVGLSVTARPARPWWKRLRESSLTLKTYTRKFFR